MISIIDLKACVLFLLSLFPFINSFAINIIEKDYTSGITSHNKYHERFQVPGEYRDYCENTRDCREYAYICNKNSCECTEGYKLDEKNKTCIGGVGSKCNYDSHCIENAFCRHQLLCICKKDYLVISNDYWNCKGEWDSKASYLGNMLLRTQIIIVSIILTF